MARIDDGELILGAADRYWPRQHLPERLKDDWVGEFCVEVCGDARNRRNDTKFSRAASRATRRMKEIDECGC